ncbi:hypothetical protein EDD80_102165 [Anseongella ginsenosidimutans]|uniref:Uncharacterized protein n=1 Tax=Anseongella ginsenosidimutans TaxID=496056 RepID=A0A4R3KVL5_9SPHI|nr:hypothetical protein [Anseongella ginsenosidimutans]TCS88974.1 hypothetical protein EDD80_102165 [Anseongella ginsenosidimutans]
MLKIFLGILAVILAVALLTNRSKEEVPAAVPPVPVTNQQGAAGAQQGATSAAPKMNPPHGQPGHRCDIAVGAPLPAAAAPAAAPQDLSPKKADTRVALNPPHGQPGHDCAVPVGKPLPQK